MWTTNFRRPTRPPMTTSRSAMKTRTTAAVTAGALALALAFTSSPASAATPAPQTLDGVKKLVEARIDKRLHTLSDLKTAIGKAVHLTAGHKSTLIALVDA